MSWLEELAVGLALLYVILAIREHRSCWLVAAASAGLYLWIFTRALLYMEAALQVFYILMSAYGWLSWGRADSPEQLHIQRWPLAKHLLVVLIIGVLTGGCGWAMARFTDAALPWLDTFTTVAALITTWMVARKVLENWLYWIVIDAVSIYLYTSRGLDLTAWLFAGYIGLAVLGFQQWHRHWRDESRTRLSAVTTDFSCTTEDAEVEQLAS